MCDHFQCDHLGNKPTPPPAPTDLTTFDVEGLRADLGTLLRENHKPPQSKIDEILAKNGLAPGTIILVDDSRHHLVDPLPLLTPELVAQMTPKICDPVDLLLEWTDQVPETPENIDIRNWEIEYLDTDCGHACTPDGCRGHETDIPIAITIGQSRIVFADEAKSSVEANNHAMIGRYIAGLIKAAKDRRAAAERAAGQIEYGTLDPSAKTVVRGREAMLDKIEEGYRLFGNVLNPGVNFLRMSGKPDLLYYVD